LGGRALAGAVAALALTGAAPGYRVAESISVHDGGWDYASVDGARQMLYIARATQVTAIDLAHGNAVRSFGVIDRGHAVVPIDGTPLLLVTSGRDNSVRLFDTTSDQEVARIPVGANPDAALYDVASGLAAVMNAKEGTVSVIDVAHRQVVRTITLKPGLEFAQLAADGTLFINNEDAGEIETASIKTGAPGAAIKLEGCEGPTGLALDPARGVLISACANGKAAVVNVASRQVMKLLPIGARPDAVILDTARRRALIPCGGDGTVTEIALGGRGAPAVAGTIKTQTGARTGALDPATGIVYLPTARLSPPATAGARPAPVPGSFVVLTLRPL
jgi:YVTN family beta-propeller protein